MKSIYTTDEVLQHICKWFADYYRGDPRAYFYWRYPDDQWSWSQHIDTNTPNHCYMRITAGTTVYELSIHTNEFKFFAEGKVYD